jgi:hypothetical protein
MQPIVLSAAISGLCAVAAALVAGWFSHAAGRRAGKAEFVAVQAAASEVITRLREEIDRLTGRCEAAEARCEAAEEHHRACREELDALWAEVRRQPLPAYVNPKPARPRGASKLKP